jgi:hypothetical protein
MKMTVDKRWCDQAPGGINFTQSLALYTGCNSDYFAILTGDILGALFADNGGLTNNQLKHGVLLLPFSWPLFPTRRFTFATIQHYKKPSFPKV